MPIVCSLLFLFNLSYHTNLTVRCDIPDRQYLYGEMLKVQANGKPIEPLTPIAAGYLSNSITIHYPLTPPAALQLDYQGCDDTTCYLPQTLRYTLTEDGRIVAEASTPAPAVAPFAATHRTAGGYMSVKEFADFLDNNTTPTLAERLTKYGWGLTLLSVLLGGLLLNLTPCVLPMIPINLAILTGLGATRRKGLLYGSTYGLGMALTYGLLGLLVMVTGSFFGALQASPWFSLCVALAFGIFALAMLDVMTIDFSRFQRTGESRTGFIVSLLTGAANALLAGACVAPIVLAVLLFSGTLYADGNTFALLLPFVLGLGMALPWPLLGAGVTILPKPGKWIIILKKLFALPLLVLAFYYAYLAWGAFAIRREISATPTHQTSALSHAKPTLVDFWATWCKNCAAMERTTLRHPDILKRLENYNLIRYQAENLNDPKVRAILQRYGITGLPAYVILPPGSEL